MTVPHGSKDFGSAWATAFAAASRHKFIGTEGQSYLGIQIAFGVIATLICIGEPSFAVDSASVPEAKKTAQGLYLTADEVPPFLARTKGAYAVRRRAHAGGTGGLGSRRRRRRQCAGGDHVRGRQSSAQSRLRRDRREPALRQGAHQGGHHRSDLPYGPTERDGRQPAGPGRLRQRLQRGRRVRGRRSASTGLEELRPARAASELTPSRNPQVRVTAALSRRSQRKSDEFAARLRPSHDAAAVVADVGASGGSRLGERLARARARTAHQDHRLVVRKPRRVEAGERAVFRARDVAGGELARLAHVDQRAGFRLHRRDEVRVGDLVGAGRPALEHVE